MLLKNLVRKGTFKIIIYLIKASFLDLHIHCPGQPGHGSLLLENTAGEKINYILNKFFEFRKQEQQKLKDNPTLNIGDVTTINLTQLEVDKIRVLSLKIKFFIFNVSLLTYFFFRVEFNQM